MHKCLQEVNSKEWEHQRQNEAKPLVSFHIFYANLGNFHARV